MIILTAIIIFLCALIGWQEYNNRKERSKLVNAIIAKTVDEAISLNLSDNTKIRAEKNKESDLELLDQVDDERFMGAIKN